MESLFIFITSFVCLFVCLSNVHGLQCNSSHEEVKCVQHCPPEKTCLNKDVYFSCSNRQEKCKLKCVCENGYYRDTTGECVTNETCEPSIVKQDRRRRSHVGFTSITKVPSCGLDEEYKTCTCPPDTCLSLVAKFICGPCEPGCACRAGYLRLSADAPCRPMRECPELAHSRCGKIEI